MKKILLLLIMGDFLSSCTTKPIVTREQKIDTLVNHYLDTTLNDPKSYESVKFGKIDTIYTSFSDDASFYKLPDNSLDLRTKDLTSNFDLYEARKTNGYYDKIDKRNELAVDSFKKVYKPKIKCLQVEHTYRAKNGFNALTMHTTGFNIDTALTKIINAYSVKD